MKATTTIKIFIALFLLVPTLALANAGKVLYAKGKVSVERDNTIELVKGDMLKEGDIIVTGKSSRAQLLMIDGARISVRANSRLEVATYSLDQPSASSISATSGAEGEVSLNLLKGGLRTITGAIGKADQDDYNMRTPVATLGIRGTDFDVQHCSGDCAPSTPDSEPPADGTYTGVNSGGINQNSGGKDLELGENEYGYTADEDSPPEETIGSQGVFGDHDAANPDEEEGDEDDSDSDSEDGGDEGSDEGDSEDRASDEGGDEGDDSAGGDDSGGDDSGGDEGGDDSAGESSSEGSDTGGEEDDTNEAIVNARSSRDNASAEAAQDENNPENTQPLQEGGEEEPPIETVARTEEGGEEVVLDDGNAEELEEELTPEPEPEPEPEPTPEPEVEEPAPEPEVEEPAPEPEVEEPAPEPEVEEPAPEPEVEVPVEEPVEEPVNEPSNPPAVDPTRFSSLAYTSNGAAYVEQDQDDTISESGGNLNGFTAPINFSDTSANQVSTNSSTVVEEVNTSSSYDLQWGRWSGSFDSGGDPVALSNGHFHWIRETDLRSSETVSLPSSGSYAYVKHDGTLPTNQAGQAGTLDHLEMSADFTNMQMSVTKLEVTTPDTNVWKATGSGPLVGSSSPEFSGSLSVSVESGGSEIETGDGAFTGFFTNFGGAGTPPGAAGVTYFMRSPTDVVSGAAAVHQVPE